MIELILNSPHFYAGAASGGVILTLFNAFVLKDSLLTLIMGIWTVINIVMLSVLI